MGAGMHDLINIGLKANSRNMCQSCYTSDNTTEVGSDNQYICYDEDCKKKNGNEIQFFVTNDKVKKFPYDQIFPTRNLREFYTKSYVK